MHIRPEAYFQKEPETVSTTFAADIEQHLGRPLTEEERAALNIVEPEEQYEDDLDVDTIERA